MRYRVTFEFDSDSCPESWYWRELLKSVESYDDSIDWSTLTLEKKSGWTPLEVDFLSV